MAFVFQRLLTLLLILFVAACGKPDDKSLCTSSSCDTGGTCDAATGECVNPSACGDLTTCIEGFACVQGQCVVEFACNDDGSCERGNCVDGACVNPDRCDADVDCVPGYACDGDQCIVDQCDVVSCDRGVCERETGECVNAAVCTAATTETDCVEGFRCYDQTCADSATVCADLECDRGECSFIDLACINSEDCGGDDLNCLEGFFCNAVNQCQQNVCDDNGTTCARGTCEASTGACVNNEPCSMGTDCVDAFYCVDSACIDANVACEVCPGNQICNYDGTTTTLSCDEDPAGCTTSLDCTGSRECSGRQCGAAVPCVADGFEPNDSQGAATDWFAVNGAAVRGTICSGDADYFSFDVSQDPQFTGTLLALVSLPASDIGVGTLSLELFDEGGASVASTTSLITDSVVRLEYTIGNINQGTYTLAISDNSVGTGGIEYELFMDLVDNATVQICQNAPVLAATQTGDTSNSSSNGLGSTCVVDPAGTEEAWQLVVTETSFVTITAQSAEFNAVISLRSQCEADSSEISCANNNTGNGTETLSLGLNPGTYYVVVQGSASSQSGAYSLAVASQPVLCTANDNTCVDPDTARVCNAQGTAFTNVPCDAGCDDAIGVCQREPGDVCTSAIDATGGFAGQVALGLLRNEYDPGPACVPIGFFSSVTDGPEAVFSVTLQPDEVVFATATPLDFDDIGIYLVNDCSDVASGCLDGVNDSDFDGDEQFAYTNTSSLPQDLYLMVDSESGTLGAVDVEIIVAPSVCTPGMQQCNGTALETCNAAGVGYDTRNCAFGCDMAATACVPPPNDTCSAGAIDVSAGGTFTGNMDDYANDYSATSACTGFSANGADAVFTFTGTPGDIVDVTLDAGFDTSLYAVTDCLDIGGTCLDGADAAGSPETIRVIVPDANPFFIVADGFSSSASGPFTLDVVVSTPDCTNRGAAIMCQPDGVTLQYCDEFGFFADYACATTCTAAKCDQPTGDQCFDAIPITPGTPVMGDYDDFNADLNPGVGTCVLQNVQHTGADAVYSVFAVAGDLLTANLNTTSFSGGMYLLNSCEDIAASCVRAAPRQKVLEYYVPVSGTYYIVVDSTSSFSSEAWTLDVTLQSGFVCQPGGATCDDPSNTLTMCSDDGLTVDGTFVCANGCANTAACAGPTAPNDTCTTAETISGSVVIADTWARFTNTLDPGAVTPNACNISSFNSDGPEAIYAVNLGAGDVVDVTLDDLGGSNSPSLYITTDCTDPESNCVNADVDAAVARAAYISDFGGTVYVVADNSGATHDDPFTIDIDIRPSECPSTLNTCRDASTREYCDGFGRIQTENCYFGCVAGACNPPTNDTCSAPTDLSAGGVATISYQGYNNDYGLTTVPCIGLSANGPDAVFSVTAAANDIITARLSAPMADTKLWITTTCGDSAACVAGDDVSGTGNMEEISYAVPTAGTYYIIADSFSSSSSGEFTLEVIVSPPICTPGDAACDTGATSVEVCNGIGSAYEVFQCDVAGCGVATGLCNTSTGEFPAAAFDGNALGTFMGSYSTFVDDFDLNDNTSCTNFDTPGPDSAYFVDLTMGQTLTATLNSSVDSALYIMDQLADPDVSCVVGEDKFGSGESVMFTAPANMRVYVIVDAFSSFAASAYTLDLSVQ